MDGPVQESAPQSVVAESPLAFLSGARAAVTFLTRIPFGKWPVSQAALHWAPAWFPVVGYVVGFLGCLVWVSVERAGGLVAAVATVSMLALITGAFHEDGLADTADAMGGALVTGDTRGDKDKFFAILKDSRIGSFGATALFLVLALRIAALAHLGPLALGGILLGQTLSRTTPVWMMAALPYVTPAEYARSSEMSDTSMLHALFASAWAAVAIALLVVGKFVPLQASLVAVILAISVAMVLGWRFYRRVGGITGDFLGTTQQVTDALILVGLATSV
jgi:adenosylcobinamide-GDP ribazoletransferase